MLPSGRYPTRVFLAKGTARKILSPDSREVEAGPYHLWKEGRQSCEQQPR